MKIAIIGPGAIGLLIAYFIERGGCAPSLIYKDVFHLSMAKSQGGPSVRIGYEEVKLSSELIYPFKELGRVYDVVFICTKAYDTDSAVSIAKRISKENALIVSAQNGIGPLEKLEESFGTKNSAAGIITYGATRYGYGLSEIRGFGKLYIGQRSPGLHENLVELIKILRDGGMDVNLVNDVDSFRWLKTLVNSAIGPITAIFKAENRVLIENENAKEVALSVLREGVEVVSRMRIRLPVDPFEETFNVARRTASNKSSMLQDVLAKRMTEVDYINGAIVRYGRVYGVPTPVNEVLINIVKGMVR